MYIFPLGILGCLPENGEPGLLQQSALLVRRHGLDPLRDMALGEVLPIRDDDKDDEEDPHSVHDNHALEGPSEVPNTEGKEGSGDDSILQEIITELMIRSIHGEAQRHKGREVKVEGKEQAVGRERVMRASEI